MNYRTSNPYLACNGSLCRNPLLGQFEPFWPWKDEPVFGATPTSSYAPLPIGFTPKQNVAPPDNQLADDVYHFIDAYPQHFINLNTGQPLITVQTKEMGEVWSSLFEATDSTPEELLWNVREYIRKNCAGEIEQSYMSTQVPWNLACKTSQTTPIPQPAPISPPSSSTIYVKESSTTPPSTPVTTTHWIPVVLGLGIAATIGLWIYKGHKKTS